MSVFIVGLGGTQRPGSSSEAALRLSLAQAEREGATTACFGGEVLANLPMYPPDSPDRTVEARELVEALRRADGVIFASPGYHGSVSGLVKNSIDYIEDMRQDDDVYLAGRAVGCVSAAYGWQAAVNTLSTLQAIVHALRGWSTPLGVAINSLEADFGADGTVNNDKVAMQLAILGCEVTRFAELAAAKRSVLVAPPKV